MIDPKIYIGLYFIRSPSPPGEGRGEGTPSSMLLLSDTALALLLTNGRQSMASPFRTFSGIADGSTRRAGRSVEELFQFIDCLRAGGGHSSIILCVSFRRPVFAAVDASRSLEQIVANHWLAPLSSVAALTYSTKSDLRLPSPDSWPHWQFRP